MVDIDLTDVMAEFSLDGNDANNMAKMVLNDVTQLILRNWMAFARKELRSTRLEYTRSLRIIEKGQFTNQIVLMGKLPNMVEQGVSAFDMKIGLLNSPKVKYTKNGKPYITVPFRWGVPTTSGDAGVFSGILPLPVYKAVKNKQVKSGGAKTGGRIHIPSPYDVRKTRKAVGNFPSYQHKNSLFSGMKGITGQYEKSNQSQYKTFRRVSLNSAKNSWIHSGIKARKLAEKALKQADIETQVENSIDNFLNSI